MHETLSPPAPALAPTLRPVATRTRGRPTPAAEAAALAALLAIAYLIVAPETADLAAHIFRTGLFEHEGFPVWNGDWYAGHHALGYSVLFPPLGALLGVRGAGALATVVAAALFGALAHGRWGDRARLGALWFAVAASANLWVGRMPFALGIALGLGALLAFQRERPWAAAALAVGTSLASPVAGAFLALAGVAVALTGRRGSALGLAAAALAPVALLSVAFPEGGSFPYAATAFWPTLAFALAAAVLVGARERTLRLGLVIYAVATVAAFAAATPMGGNAARLGMLFGGPVLACVLHGRRARVLALLALPLLYWSIAPAVRDVAAAAGDPSTSTAYYAPLLRFLDSARKPGAPPPRIEIVFTRNHWEAARVAPHIPIARGWERQVDRKVNKLFYRPGLTAAAYRVWLERTGVRWVALPDVKLDYSAKAEAQLIRAGLPYLRPAWHSAHWQVFAVRPAPALIEGPARLTAMGAESFSVRARRPGRVVVRVRFTSHWRLPQAAGCVTRSPEGWTELHLRQAGPVSVRTAFAPGGDDAGGPRCAA